ncbi:hypothetical protein [Carnobacterium divergens]|uniref:hypothetical protein n=1 Tax=Carnobacterium divergens TaxID=2748 RepID=UPI0039AF934E
MTISFRKIKNEDFSVCATILMAAYNGAPWNNTWTKKDALLRIEATMSGFNSRGYVVEKNNEDDVNALLLGVFFCSLFIS